MNKQEVIDIVMSYAKDHEGNFVAPEIALSPELKGMRMYDEPIFAFGSAFDPLFEELKNPEIIGPHLRLPQEWLEGARTVVSLFFPISERIKESNGKDYEWPSCEWLHARIDGHRYIEDVMQYMKDTLAASGHSSVIPSMDKGLSMKNPAVSDNREQAYYTSNWSERHAAFICGNGTFGLSKGLITKKGVAGRLASIITDFETEPDKRPYKYAYEYCSMCGACIRHCPVSAISFEKGKIHCLCSDFLNETREKHNPRYGCGKCQVNVPCESAIPRKMKAI